MELTIEKTKNFTATRNACKLCAPLGASLVFRGIKNTLPLLHGSQGCATYIRRYMISHFKEPVDISSSNFSEETAVFGGSHNLKKALLNVITQYNPDVIGIASTCLSETIGDDVRAILKEFYEENKNIMMPYLIHVSTPSYRGTHMDGFHESVKAIVDQMVQPSDLKSKAVNILPGMLSPEDLRYFKQIFADMQTPVIMLPDYSETLDGPSWKQYHTIPPGGTSLIEIENMSSSQATIECGASMDIHNSAGNMIWKKYNVPLYQTNIPIGIRATDAFFELLTAITGLPVPNHYMQARGRLIDAYADAHKYIFEKQAVLYGEQDLVIAMAGFLREVGIIPVLCATGSKDSEFETRLRKIIPEYDQLGIKALTDVDFLDIETKAEALHIDMVIGNSKGYKLSQKLGVPLIRIGFPIHDRIGGQRILHVGYHGTQQLFDRITNAVIEKKQAVSPVGYTYM